MFHKPRSKNKIIHLAIIFLFVLQLATPALLYPQPVRAQVTGPEVMTATQAAAAKKIAADKWAAAKKSTEERIKAKQQTFMQKLKKGLILSASITLRNTLVMMARTAAQQSITFMQTGGVGNEPMFYTQAWGQFQKDIMNYTVGQFLSNIRGMAWDKIGLDICNPNPQVKLKIVLGQDWQTRQDSRRPAPDCTWQAFTTNWSKAYDTMNAKYTSLRNNPSAASVAMLQQATEVSFGKKGSDVGIYLTVEDQLRQQQAQELDAKNKERMANKDAKSVTTLTGLNIKTPAFLTSGYMTSESDALR
ncbi:MAG: hypothetical protein V1928_00055, partial [Parcubacteria group bacterium]